MARFGLRQHIAAGTRLAAGPAAALWLVVLAGCAWGARATFLEGFRDARPRGFAGDFTAAMFTNQYWDGTGVLYGPVFVFERWLVDAAPSVFTPTFFAVACIPPRPGGVRRARSGVPTPASRRPHLVVALWLCSSRLSYSFSVAANPECLELAFIAGAVALAVPSGRRNERGEGALLGAAALTKYVPWALVPGLLARRRWQAIVGAVVCFVVLAVVTAIGQGTGPIETVGDILFPVGSYADGQLFASCASTPRSSSTSSPRSAACSRTRR